MHIHFVGFGSFAVTSSFFFGCLLFEGFPIILLVLVSLLLPPFFGVVSSLWRISYSPLRFCIYLEDIAM